MKMIKKNNLKNEYNNLYDSQNFEEKFPPGSFQFENIKYWQLNVNITKIKEEASNKSTITNLIFNSIFIKWRLYNNNNMKYIRTIK